MYAGPLPLEFLHVLPGDQEAARQRGGVLGRHRRLDEPVRERAGHDRVVGALALAAAAHGGDPIVVHARRLHAEQQRAIARLRQIDGRRHAVRRGRGRSRSSPTERRPCVVDQVTMPTVGIFVLSDDDCVNVQPPGPLPCRARAAGRCRSCPVPAPPVARGAGRAGRSRRGVVPAVPVTPCRRAPCRSGRAGGPGRCRRRVPCSCRLCLLPPVVPTHATPTSVRPARTRTEHGCTDAPHEPLLAVWAGPRPRPVHMRLLGVEGSESYIEQGFRIVMYQGAGLRQLPQMRPDQPGAAVVDAGKAGAVLVLERREVEDRTGCDVGAVGRDRDAIEIEKLRLELGGRLRVVTDDGARDVAFLNRRPARWSSSATSRASAPAVPPGTPVIVRLCRFAV